MVRNVGSLTGSSPFVIDLTSVFAIAIAGTVTFVLKSSAVGRLIEFSVDGGTEYFTPAYDRTSTTMLVVIARGQLTNVRFTGAAADTWSFL